MKLYRKLLKSGGKLMSKKDEEVEVEFGNIIYGFDINDTEALRYIVVEDTCYHANGHVVVFDSDVFFHRVNLTNTNLQEFIHDMRAKGQVECTDFIEFRKRGFTHLAHLCPGKKNQYVS